MLSSYRGNSNATSPQASDKPILVNFAGGSPVVRADFVGNEIPAGTVDGVNDTFTLASNPDPDAFLMLFINGMLQYAGGVNYTLSGTTITFAAASIPQTGDLLRAFYVAA